MKANIGPIPPKCQGFTLLEIMTVIGIVSVLTMIGVVAINSVHTTAGSTKLQHDLASLNSAVNSYLAFGGKFEGTETLPVILAKLKSRASDATKNQIVGLSGSFLDPRIEIVMQSDEEAATDAKRLYWNAAKRRFESARSGPAGIKQIKLNENYEEPETELVEARETTLDYSHESSWIWDYQDSNAPTPLQPSQITVALSPPPGSSPLPGATPVGAPPTTPPPPVAPPPTTATVLDPPTFSPAPGTFPISTFDVEVQINDPNPTGSTLYYSIDSGPWTPYPGGPLSLSPGGVLEAQAHPTSNEYLFSVVTGGTYEASPEALDDPVINLSGAAFTPPSVETVNVTINNPNDGTVSRIDYRINSGSWQTYSGVFPINYSDYPGGASVQAYAVSTSPHWLNSGMDSAIVTSPVPDVDLGVSVSTDP